MEIAEKEHNTYFYCSNS